MSGRELAHWPHLMKAAPLDRHPKSSMRYARPRIDAAVPSVNSPPASDSCWIASEEAPAATASACMTRTNGCSDMDAQAAVRFDTGL